MDESRSNEARSDISDDDLLEIVRMVRDASSARRRERAFEMLFERYHAKVYRWCVRVLGDSVRAEDLTQAIFVDIWQNRRPYHDRGRFGAWLYVTCRNRCLNALRDDRRRPDEEWDERLAEVLTSRSDPHTELERIELDRRITDVCRRRLNALEQQVVVLRYAWGMRVDEITTALELTNASGARTHLRSAEVKLRRYLQGLYRETEGG